MAKKSVHSTDQPLADFLTAFELMYDRAPDALEVQNWLEWKAYDESHEGDTVD